MSQSLSKLYVHIVFHVKNNQPFIRKQDCQKLYAFIGKIIKENDSIPIKINGVEDHIHILCILSKNITLADLLKEIKRNSSRWIKGLDNHYSHFAWQGGYGGFSVSQSMVEKTIKYIENQEEHHKKMTLKKEYLLFLKEYGIDYDEKYLWKD